MDEDLIDHQKKCRFCLGKIKSTRLAVHMSEDIEQSFFSLTNSKLKTSENYSSVICKACLKDLESSVGFQQKIIVNQQRLEKFEFDDTVPVKEEAVETEDLRTVEIKTECFEFEASSVAQWWQQPAKADSTEPEIEIKPDNVPEESPASAHSDDDFKADFHEDDSSDSWNSELVEEVTIPVTKPLKAASETNETRICPYCAGVYSKGGIKAHIERHENKINNTSIKCHFCDFESFSRTAVTAHVRYRHPEKYKPKSKSKKPQGVNLSDKDRRKIIVDAHLENPSMSLAYLAKRLKFTQSTVARVVQRYKERNTIERAPHTGNRRTGDMEIYDRIARSFTSNPEWSDRLRAKKLGASSNTVGRVRIKIGFQRDVDESTRIYQCQQCPRKYSHNTTLTAHIKDKHMQPE